MTDTNSPLAFLSLADPCRTPQEVWTFDRIDRIGGHATTVLGHPRVIETPLGKAVEFNGVDDGLLIDNHPLAGAETFTWEAIFRPDGGNAEQRWFHLEENPATGSDADSRMLFEIRVIDGRGVWTRSTAPARSKRRCSIARTCTNSDGGIT